MELQLYRQKSNHGTCCLPHSFHASEQNQMSKSKKEMLIAY